MLTSVVIPIRDAADQLLFNLFSFNLQFTAFDEFEVIVVDNASRDGLEEKFARFSAHFPLSCVRYRKRVPFHELLNTGIQQANGDVIVFLSCNMLVPRNFIGVHRHAHDQDHRVVLLGLGARRIYSVYEPQFTPIQHAECSHWLENYPQIKRPHTHAATIPLLEESQIASGLPFHISLPCPEAEKRMAVMQKYGPRLARHRSPWTLFQTSHVSLSRSCIAKVGLFRALPRVEMEREMAKRLLKNGFIFQFADKLTLIKQERAIRKVSERDLPRKNRRAQ